MQLADLRARLAELQPWLDQRGVARVRVFGPHAKDRAEPGGDVHLLVNYSRRLSLMETIGIESELARKLAAPVQLASVEALKTRDRRRIESQAVDA
jgi:uncharacterized protein